MIYWNTASQKIIDRLLTAFIHNENHPQFILLSGPAHVWKAAYVKQLIQNKQEENSIEVLDLKDMSSTLGKQHILKVKQDPKSPTIEQATQIYNDLWIREVTKRLQQTSYADKKILVMENIERMNLSAANAFLKAAEEPLPGRLIIATTSHQSILLDTIVSRAFIVRFDLISDSQMHQLLSENSQMQSSRNESFQAIVYKLAMGRPGLLFEFMEKIDEEMQDILVKAAELLQSQEPLYTKISMVQKLQELWLDEWFLDVWISLAQWDLQTQQALLEVKKLYKTNVNRENLFLGALV